MSNTINVRLSNGALTTVPISLALSGSSSQHITWNQSGSPSSFTFVGIAFLSGQSNFTNVTINSTQTQITADDSMAANGTYNYVIMAKDSSNNFYVNVAAASPAGDGSSSSIKNN